MRRPEPRYRIRTKSVHIAVAGVPAYSIGMPVDDNDSDVVPAVRTEADGVSL